MRLLKSVLTFLDGAAYISALHGTVSGCLVPAIANHEALDHVLAKAAWAVERACLRLNVHGAVGQSHARSALKDAQAL